MQTKLLKIKGTEELAVIDAEDYERVKSFNWQVEYGGVNNNRQYVGCRIGELGKQKCIRLAHMILGFADSGKRIHIKYLNKNTFDLRKSNLQSVNTGEHFGSAESNLKICSWSNDKEKLSPWTIYIYFRGSQQISVIGKYTSEQNAKNVIRYIKENNIPVSNQEELKLYKPVIRTWAIKNGFANPPFSFKERHIYEIGDEKIQKGFIRIKTEKGWRPKHHVIWEQAGNPLPENHFLIFKDGNKRNFNLENFEMLSHSQFTQQIYLLGYPKELRPTVELVRQLNREIKELKIDQPKIDQPKIRKIKNLHPQSLLDLFSIGVDFYIDKTRPHKLAWRVRIYCPSISKIPRYIGYYKSREIAEEIRDFIKTSNFSIKSREDIENIRSLVKDFAVEKGYRKPSKSRNNSTINTTTVKQ